MADSAGLATAVVWAAGLAGVVVAVAGLFFLAVLFSGGGVPVGGAGPLAMLSLGVGPVLILAGAAMVFLAVKLMGGQGWARPMLEWLFWFGALVSIGYLVYSWARISVVEARHLVQGVVFLGLTGGPAVVMALLLRTMWR